MCCTKCNRFLNLSFFTVCNDDANHQTCNKMLTLKAFFWYLTSLFFLIYILPWAAYPITVGDHPSIRFLAPPSWYVSRKPLLRFLYFSGLTCRQFHQCFMYGFYACRSPKSVKNTVKSSVSLYAFRICKCKSCT